MPLTNVSLVSLGRVRASEIRKSELFNFALEGRAKKLHALLADKSVDVDSCNTRGQTPLFVSCMCGHVECVLLLLEYGANPNRRSDDGSTPTHAAAFSCLPSILTAVVKNGGDLRLHDNRDLSARDWALEAGSKKNKKIIKLLDQWHSEIVRQVVEAKQWEGSSSSSLNRLFRRESSSSSSSSIVCKQKTSGFQTGFGDYVSLQVLSSEPDNELCMRNQVGFAALLPCISQAHLTNVHSAGDVHYEAPPLFTISSGRWGSQNVMVKQPKRPKRRCSTAASSSDLLIMDVKWNGLLRHPHMLLLRGVCVDDNFSAASKNVSRFSFTPQCLIYENVKLGSMYHVLHEKKSVFPVKDCIKLLLQLCDALLYIHQRGFIHCCISSHAIHFTNEQTLKLSDFYYSTHSQDSAGLPNRVSPVLNRWLSPELLAEKQPSFVSDVYSFCVVACELISGILPWKGFDPDSIRHHIVSKGRMLTVPSAVPATLQTYLSKGLSLSRKKRSISIQQLGMALHSYLQPPCGKASQSQTAYQKSKDDSAGASLCFNPPGTFPDVIGLDVPDGDGGTEFLHRDVKGFPTDVSRDMNSCNPALQSSPVLRRCSAPHSIIGDDHVGYVHSDLQDSLSEESSIRSGDQQFMSELCLEMNQRRDEDEPPCYASDYGLSEMEDAVLSAREYGKITNNASVRARETSFTTIKPAVKIASNGQLVLVDGPEVGRNQESRCTVVHNKTAPTVRSVFCSTIVPEKKSVNCQTEIKSVHASLQHEPSSRKEPDLVSCSLDPVNCTGNKTEVFPQKETNVSRVLSQQKQNDDVSNKASLDSGIGPSCMLIASSTFEVLPINTAIDDDVTTAMPSPLHTSVQKVQKSLVEFSQLFDPPQVERQSVDSETKDVDTLSHASTMNDVKTGDVTHTVDSPPASLRDDDSLGEAPEIVLNAETFLKEVLCAAGIELEICGPQGADGARGSQPPGSKNGVDRTTDSTSRKREMTRRNSDKSVKRRQKWYIKRYPSLQQTSGCHDDKKVGLERAVVRSESFGQDCVDGIEVARAEPTSCARADKVATNNNHNETSPRVADETTLANVIANADQSQSASPRENQLDESLSVPCPSGVLLCPCKNPNLELLKEFERDLPASYVTSVPVCDDGHYKRFSITSDDLEDIFADFADRKTVNRIDDVIQPEVHVSESDSFCSKGGRKLFPLPNAEEPIACLDVTDGRAKISDAYQDLCTPLPLSEDQEVRKISVSSSVDQSCQTSLCELHSDLSSANRYKPAVNPPTIDNFIFEAGRFSGLAQPESIRKSPLGGLSTTKSSPELGQSKIPELTLARNSLIRVALKSTESRATQVADQLPGEISHEIVRVTSVPVCQARSHTSSIATNHSCDVTSASRCPLCGDVDLHATPSKWSFKHKLMLFEEKCSSEQEAKVETLGRDLSPIETVDDEEIVDKEETINEKANDKGELINKQDKIDGDEIIDNKEQIDKKATVDRERDQAHRESSHCLRIDPLSSLAVSISTSSADCTDSALSLPDDTESRLFVTAAESELSCKMEVRAGKVISNDAAAALSTSTPVSSGRHAEVESEECARLSFVSQITWPQTSCSEPCSAGSNLSYPGLDGSGTADVSSVFKEELIPRSHLLPALSDTSSSQSRSLNDQDSEPTSPLTPSVSDDQAYTSSIEEVLDTGVDLLSSQLTASVLHNQAMELEMNGASPRFDWNSPVGNDPGSFSQISNDFSGISYDCTHPDKSFHGNAVADGTGDVIGCQEACDTSVWVESRISSFYDDSSDDVSD